MPKSGSSPVRLSGQESLGQLETILDSLYEVLPALSKTRQVELVHQAPKANTHCEVRLV
jgi:hypothetical protein